MDGKSLYNIPSLSLEEAIAKKNELVLKPIMGECGFGVIVGKNVKKEIWRKALKKTYSDFPEDFLFFEYVDILQEDNHLLIHRFFVDVFKENVSTRPGAYIRMKNNDGDGVISTGNPGTIASAVLIENINIYREHKSLKERNRKALNLQQMDYEEKIF